MLPIRFRGLPAPTTGERIIARCLKCRTTLAVHQPDPDAPGRLLGTCESCGSWHLIDLAESALILLPDCRTIRKAIQAAPRRARKRSSLAG
jgi:hypothetical protein